MISPEEILASQGAGLDRAAQEYASAPLTVAQSQFLQALRDQSDMQHLKTAGEIQKSNELALQAARGSDSLRNELALQKARTEGELSNKLAVLPIEHKNRLEEVEATARAYIDRMAAADKQKEKARALAAGLRQDPGESDDDFLMRANKAHAAKINSLSDSIDATTQQANDLMQAEARRLNVMARDRALKEWAAQLDSREKKLLAAGKGPEDIVALSRDRDRKAALDQAWSAELERQQEKVKLSRDPAIDLQIRLLASKASRFEKAYEENMKALPPGAAIFLGHQAGSTGAAVPANQRPGEASLFGASPQDVISTTGKAAPSGAVAPNGGSADDVFNLPGASGIGAFPGMLKQAGSAALDAIGSIMFPRSNAPTPSPGQIPPGLIINTAPPPPFAPEPIDPNLILNTPAYVRPYEY